jgi:hypothetical protein
VNRRRRDESINNFSLFITSFKCNCLRGTKFNYNQARERGVLWVWNPGEKERLRAQWTRPNIDFDPVPFLEKVKCPVIAFFGEKDVLVPPEGNVSIMEAALKKAGNLDVTIKVLPGVNHNFQLPWMGSYGFQSSGKTPPGYYDVMIPWLKKTSRCTLIRYTHRS